MFEFRVEGWKIADVAGQICGRVAECAAMLAPVMTLNPLHRLPASRPSARTAGADGSGAGGYLQRLCTSVVAIAALALPGTSTRAETSLDVPQTLAVADANSADAAAARAARARFDACVTRVVPQLDDRTSQADVVAKGVFGACRGELPASVAQGPAFENALLPGLTAAVLAHRASSRRVSLPTRPARGDAR